MSLPRACGAAWEAIRAAPLSHLVASLTVGATLLVAVGSGAFAWGARQLLADWGSRIELTLYLSDELDEEQGRRLAEEAARTIGGRARWVSPGEAMARLSAALDDDGALLDLPMDPLPATIELSPSRPTGVEELSHLAQILGRLPGVEEVDWGREWAERLGGLSRLAEAGLAALLTALFLGTLLLVGAVIRFAIHSRREELEILRLLGATEAFVRLPFYLEGALAGAAGGGFAALGLVGLLRWLEGVALVLPMPSVPLGSLPLAASALVAGSLLGLAATALALSRESK